MTNCMITSTFGPIFLTHGIELSSTCSERDMMSEDESLKLMSYYYCMKAN